MGAVGGLVFGESKLLFLQATVVAFNKQYSDVSNGRHLVLLYEEYISEHLKPFSERERDRDKERWLLVLKCHTSGRRN